MPIMKKEMSKKETGNCEDDDHEANEDIAMSNFLYGESDY